MNPDRVSNTSNDASVSPIEERLSRNDSFFGNLDEANVNTLQESNNPDIDQSNKLIIFLVKIFWFFIIWGTLHWIFA
jgi:hypothetical protein